MARALGSLPMASAGPSAAPASSSLRLAAISGEQLSFLPTAPKSVQARRRLHSAVVLAREGNAYNSSSDDQAVRAASLSLFAALLTLPAASPALAVSAEDITNALLKVQDITGKATNAVGSAYSTSKGFLEQLFATVKPAVDAATPYMQKATDAAVQVVTPIASDVVSQADMALKNAGLDTKPVVDAAKSAVVVAGEAAEQTAKVVEGAKPVATSTLEFIISADPLFIVGSAGALLLLYLITPSLLSSVAYAARGYKGDLSAAQVLDLLSASNYVLIDVRREKEKAKSGLPSLPRNAKNKYIAIPLEDLPGKLKGQLQNPRKLEAEIAAIEISFLKRIGRGSNVILLDSFGNIGKMVAKSLVALGFKNTWVVSDGFDGGKGWVQSMLGTDSFNTSFPEVLSPSRVVPAGTKKLFKTTSSEIVEAPSRFNKLLPGGFEE